MKTFGVTDYTNLAPHKMLRTDEQIGKKCLSSTPIKNEKKQ